MVQSKLEVVLGLENYVQVDALTVVDFTMLYVVVRRLLLSSRVSSLVINLLTINLSFRDGPREKLWGGGEEFESRGKFFSLSNSLYEVFLGHSMNIFLGLIGVQEFFSFNFPLREYFFCATAS